MDQGIAIVVVGGFAFASPFLLTVLQGKTRRRERAEDFARQDAVARKVDAVADTARATASDTNAQLKQIHTLVNSDMTAARQGELDQTRLTLLGLNTIIGMAKAMGQEPKPEQLEAIGKTEGRIAELEAILADRMAQMRIIEAESKAKL